MRRLALTTVAAGLTLLVGVAGCGGGGTTINGQAVPTDPKEVCQLFADQSDSDGSDDAFTDEQYQQVVAWADNVEDDAMSKDLRALVTLVKELPSDGATSSDGSDGSLGVALEMLSVYNSLTADCAKYGVTLPDPMSDGPSSASDSPSVAATDEAPLAFGQTKVFDDGLSLTVSQPVEFEPSEYAATSKAPSYVGFKVTLHNGTGSSFDPSSFHASMQSGSTDEDQVFDSAKGLDGPPSTQLLDGRDSVFTIGFGAEDVTDLVLDLNVDYEHPNVIYVSSP